MSSFKDEFQLKNFGFGYDKPYKFSLSEWRGPHGLFVAWRVFWCLWHLAWIVVSVEDQVSDEEYGEKWFIYLTNWSYVMLTIQTLVALAVTVNSTCKGRKTVGDFNQGESETLSGSVNSTSWLEKTMWLFTAISFNGAIIVTIVYWGFIFEEFTHVLNIVTHAVTTFYVICDVFISASPTRLLHFIYACAFGTVYGLFTIFYHLGDGTNNAGEPYVYKIIDWSNVGSSAGVLLGLILVATPVVHLFIFGMHTLRMFLSQRCACGKQSGKEGDDMQMA